MIHILLAEDEIALAKIIKDSLESLPDFKITLASNGEKAFELYADKLTKSACLEVATTDWGSDPASGFNWTDSPWQK